MKWEKVAIKSVCKGIYDGPHATPPVSDTGAIFLGISNFSNGRLDLSNIRFISENDLPRWTKRVTPQASDIVFSYEATLNLYAVIPDGFRGCLGRRMALIRVDEEKAYYKFLYYYFYSDAWRVVIQENTVLGATVDRIPLVKFPDFLIDLPPLVTQHRIADVLSAYDNLIENNQKQIKLLEEATQRLYKEWFVDLRFPGYEDVKIVDGVPEGWNCQFLAEVVSYEIGGGWGEDSVTEKCDKPAYVIRGTDLHSITNGNISGIPYRYHVNKNLEARALEDGDIIFEVSGVSKAEGVARTVLIRDTVLEFLKAPVMCASFCKLVRVNEKQYSQLLFDTFQYMRSSGKTGEYDKKSASSIVNYRWKDFLVQETILIPTNELLLKYDSLSANLYRMILTKSVEIEKVKEARDRILPKLMSGEIQV